MYNNYNDYEDDKPTALGILCETIQNFIYIIIQAMHRFRTRVWEFYY